MTIRTTALEGTTMRSTLSEGVELLKVGRLREAADCFSQLLSSDPKDARPWHFLGLVAGREHDYKRAAALMETSLKLDGSSPDCHHNLGSTCRVLGRFEEAEQHYATALRLKPDYAEAYFNLSQARKFSADDPEPAAVVRQLERTGLSSEEFCFLHFAAGKMQDDLGNYDLAFGHYRQGNDARQIDFDSEAHSAHVQRLMEIFDHELVGSTAGRPRVELPVFVVGMPRSGTTLVEQILASHPEVFGGGELPDIRSICGTLPEHTADRFPYPECVPQLSDSIATGFGRSYLTRLRTLDADAARIVNKTPGNYEHLGMIAMMLPGARVIHCRRDPLDTCLSCYFQRFRTGQEFSYSLEDLGSYYRRYERLMEHWRDVLPEPVFEVDYEALVDQPEETARDLIDYLGLPWDAQCMKFYESERPVTTASNWQVRQPLYRSAVRRWEKYASHLGPLRAALEAHAAAPV